MDFIRMNLWVAYILGVSFLTAQEVEVPWSLDDECGTIVTDEIAIVSCGATSFLPLEDRFTLGMINLKALLPDVDRVDKTLDAEMYHHPSWHIDSIGNIFGISMDNCGNAYVAASANWSSSFFLDMSILKYGSLAGDDYKAAGAIYKIDAYTGQASVFCTLPQQETEVRNHTCEGFGEVVRNTGPAIGNICFHNRTNQFYVTNFEDGRIYRIDRHGTILDSFDPFDYDDGLPGHGNHLTYPYGVAVHPEEDELFFGTNGHFTHLIFPNPDTTFYHAGDSAHIYFPRVSSIQLNPDGSFVGVVDNSVLPFGATWDNYIGEENIHWTAKDLYLRDELIRHWESSFFISDIEFSPNDKLLVACRVGCGADLYTAYNHDGTTYALNKILSRYDEIDGEIFTSYANGNNDAYGGVSSYLDSSGKSVIAISSSDMLIENGPHGICLQEEGVYGDENNPASPSAVISYSSDFYTDAKGIGGDVFVFRDCNQRNCDILNGSVDLILNNERKLSVFPNPYSAGFDIKFFADSNQSLVINFLTIDGKTVHSIRYHAQIGQNSVRVDEEILNKFQGLLVCELRSRVGSQVLKIISQAQFD